MPNPHHYQEPVETPDVSGTLCCGGPGHTIFLNDWNSVVANSMWPVRPDVYIIEYSFSFMTSEYDLWRTALLFDTSYLTINSQIMAANLYVNAADDDDVWADEAFDVVIQNGQPTFPSNPIVAGDYDRTHYSGDGGSISAAAMALAGWYAIPLNATGLTWINKTGYTKLMLRNSNDIAGTPPTGFNEARFASGASSPYLDIAYIGPPHSHLVSTQSRTILNDGGFGIR